MTHTSFFYFSLHFLPVAGDFTYRKRGRKKSKKKKEKHAVNSLSSRVFVTSTRHLLILGQLNIVSSEKKSLCSNAGWETNECPLQKLQLGEGMITHKARRKTGRPFIYTGWASFALQDKGQEKRMRPSGGGE